MSSQLIEALRPRESEASEHYRRTISPGHRVAVVGPSISPFVDPTLLWTAARLAKSGRVYIADPQSDEKLTLDELIRLRPQTGGVVGTGNFASYLRELDAMRACGLPLAHPIWLGKESGVYNLPLPDGSVDRIVDHHTAVFVAGWTHGRIHTLDTPQPLIKTFHEYHRALTPHGILLLQTDAIHWRVRADMQTTSLKQIIPQLLANVGFAVKHFSVRDIFTVNFPKTVFQRYACVDGLADFGPFSQDKLRILVSHYPSPDLYICRKI